MKKKLCILIPLGILLLITLIVVGILLFGGLVFKKGTYLESDSGVPFFVTEEGDIWRMNGMKKNMFGDIESGDKLLVLMRNYLAESYPCQCYIELCFDIGEGDDMTKIPEGELLAFGEMGYFFTDSLPVDYPDDGAASSADDPVGGLPPSAEELAEAEALFDTDLSDVNWSEYMLDEGYILFSGNTPIFVWDDGSCATFETRPELPADLVTGDRILILRMDMILETYPGQIMVHRVAKLKDGSPANIPRRALEGLIELGWTFDFDPDELQHSGTEAGFKMLRYNWDGYGIGTKEIYACELSYAILDRLSSLRETGETVPEISDEMVDEDAGELPVTPGTVWIECGTVGLFRLNREMTEICKVETHLGAGKTLQMTEELQDLLNQAWFYFPNDCWSGSYENGEVTLHRIAKAESAVASVSVDSIFVENDPHSENNQITLRILANESKTAEAYLSTYQSEDNLGASDRKEVKLIKGEETTVTLTFGGFCNHSYYITVMIDNTRITLTIDPKSAS